MEIKRKSATTPSEFRARLLVYPDADANGHAPSTDPAGIRHRFGIGAGELLASAEVNAKCGDQIVPALEITVPGFGTLLVTPNEVHQLLVMIEEIQTKARHAATYVSRDGAVSVSV